MDCISTRTTSIGWFHVASAPPVRHQSRERSTLPPTRTDRRAEDLVERVQFLVFAFTPERPDRRLGKTREAHSEKGPFCQPHMRFVLRKTEKCAPRTPIRHLPESDSIDALVDPSQPFPPPDVGEDGPGRGWLDTGGCLFVTRDFRRFHACAEACCFVVVFGRVRLLA